MNQKRHMHTKLIFKNYIFSFFPFKNMAIMTTCCLSIQTKNSFDEVLNLGFDLGHLKMNTYCIKSQFYKALSKGFI